MVPANIKNSQLQTKDNRAKRIYYRLVHFIPIMKKVFFLIVLVLSFVISACGEDRNEPNNLVQEFAGDSIGIGRTNLIAYKTLPRALSQAMAVYGDYIILFTYDTSHATAFLYKFSEGKLLATLSLPNGTCKRPHCNAASFSRIYNNSRSILPLLYVSQWDNDSEKGCFVYDITLNNGSYKVDLVQTILPTNVSTSIRGAGQTDWVVDPISGNIYSVGYLLDDGARILSNNKLMVAKYKLPTISDGSVVTFANVDVLDHFDIPIFIYRQDMCFEFGCIVMLAGMTNNTAARRLVFINPDLST